MPDAPSRVERVLNLLALLLKTRVPLTREQIVREVTGYPPQISAYRRAFERDKEMLRGMGVPITMETIGNDTELGYRVRPDDYYLPDLGLTAEETAALRVAVSAVWLGNAVSGASSVSQGALMKIGGLAAEAATPIASLPIAPALAALFDAFRTRAVVTFSYRGQTRTLEPWGLSSKRGHWYVVGHDRDREAIRAFRADRIEGDVGVGEPDAFHAPADFQPDEHVEDRPWLLGDEPPVVARLAVDAGHTEGMVDHLGPDAIVERAEDGSAVVQVTVTNRAAFRSFVLGFLGNAELLAPPELRADIVAWLERIARGGVDARTPA